MVSANWPPAPPFNTIPLVITLAEPISTASSVRTWPTPSLLPNVTATASVTVSIPRVWSPGAPAPISPSKTTLPVAAVTVRLLCSPVSLSTVSLNVIPAVPVSVIVTSAVSNTGSWNVTVPPDVLMSASISAVPGASVVMLSSGAVPPTSALNRVVTDALTMRSEPVAPLPSSSTVDWNVTLPPAVTITSSVTMTASSSVTSVPAVISSFRSIWSAASTSIAPVVAVICPRMRISAWPGDAAPLSKEISRPARIC